MRIFSWNILFLQLLLIAGGGLQVQAADLDANQCRNIYPSYPQPKIVHPPVDTMNASARNAVHTENLSTQLIGDVEITKESWQINSDIAWIDEATGDFRIEGAVTIQEPGLIISGDRATGNLNDQSATVNAASFLIPERRLSGKADKITIKADQQLVLHSGEFTTCEPDNHVWAIKSKSVLIKPEEGYGTARHVTLHIKGIPIAYTPYFRFPTSDKRQSGFLTPSLGRKSDGGTDLAVPWYINLAPNYDATYTLRNIWQRGLIHEGEIRYLGSLGNVLIGGAFLSDDDQYKDPEQMDLAGTNTGLKKQNRWFTRLSHRGVTRGWVSRLNYARVSDIDYLHDFGSQVGSATDYATGANSVSGASQPPALRQAGSLSYGARHWRGILELQNFQNLRQSPIEQYATLPKITLDYARQVSVFDVKSRIQVARYRKDDDDLSIGTPAPGAGSRLVLDSQVSLPLRRPWGFFTPAVGIIHRHYDLTDYPSGSAPTLRDAARITTRRVSLDAGLVFERNKTLWGKPVYQTLETRVYYLYLEEKFQDDLPSFDSVTITPSLAQIFRANRFTGYDRIGDARQVALGISTNISSAQTGAQILSAGIGQLLYFKNRNVGIQDVVRETGPDMDRKAGSSPLFARIEARFTPALTAHSTFEWRNLSGQNPGKTNRSHLSVRYHARKGSIFNLSYAYAAKNHHRRTGPDAPGSSAEESDLSFILPATPSWSVIGRWHYSLDRSQTLESLFGVEYNGCCWKLRLILRRYLDEPRRINLRSSAGLVTRFDRRAKRGIFFEFQLKGLTSLGGRLDPLLEDAIPGYSGL